MFFKRTVAELLAEPDDVATTPPVAPPTHRFGVPDGAISLAVDALQQTVAVGARSGEVMLFAGGAQMLLPPPVESPVRHLAFATNSGRLLSIHAPGTACIWDLRDSVRLEARSKLTEPSGTDAVISIAKMIPGSSLALLGTAEGTALAYDVVAGKEAPWSLGCGDGPLCALEANPLEPRRVLAGQKRGALQVFELAPGGGARVCSFAAPSEQAGGDEPGLCCATWSARQLLAGYDDGRVLVHSVRNPAAPNATILVNPFGAGPRRPEHVRERGDFTLEKAIWELTGAQTERLGFKDRGILAPGYAGDLTVFDLDDLSWGSEYFVKDLPSGAARLRRPPGGFRVTVCNGVVTQRDGELTGANPGRVLDGGVARPA